MGCCGQKRDALSHAGSRPGPLQPPATGSARPPPPADAWRQVSGGDSLTARSTRLRYLERSAVLVRGSFTGLLYRFSASSPVQVVDNRDAEGLLATRFFAQG